MTSDSTHTERLLKCHREGDPRALNNLFERHRAYLRRVVELRLDPKLRRRVDASDVLQDAQLEAARRMDAYPGESKMPFRLWLRQITYDQLLMASRRHITAKRRTIDRELPLPEQSSLQLARQLRSSGTTPSQHLVRRELGRRVREAVARMTAADREILLMRNFEGLSNQEVAQVLQIDPAAASKRYGRALLRLRPLLDKTGNSDSES